MSCLVTRLQGVVDNPNLPKFKELTIIARRYGRFNTVLDAGGNYELDSTFNIYSCEYVSQDNPLRVKFSTNISIISISAGTINTTTNEICINTPNTFCVITYNFNTPDHNNDTGYITFNNKYLLGGLAGCNDGVKYIYRLFLKKSSDLIGMKNLHYINGIHIDQYLFNYANSDILLPAKKLAARELYTPAYGIYTYFQPYWITGDLSDLNFSNTNICSLYTGGDGVGLSWSNYMNSSLYNNKVRLTNTLNPMGMIFDNKDFSKANFDSVWYNSPYGVGATIKWTASSKAARGRNSIFTLNGVSMEPTDMHNYLLCFSEYTDMVNITGDYACIKIYTVPNYDVTTASTNVKSAINTILERNVRIIINSVNINRL